MTIPESKTQFGTIDIELIDKTVTLKPTLKAALAIERKFNGIPNAVSAVAGRGIEATAFVVVHGAGLEPESDTAKTMTQTVYDASVMRISTQCLPFLYALLNPGNKKAGDDQGNAATA